MSSTQISLELIPRTRSGLRAELAAVREQFPSVGTVNIPDLTRFSTRSWEACTFGRPHFRTIPHVRAIDLDPGAPLPMAELLAAHGIEDVLIITGDAPSDMNRRVYNVDAEQAIRRFTRELPQVRVYAGLDPYRHSFAQERDYLERKLCAGAVGFFTQPFFDLRLMDAYADLIPPGAEVWWGLTNVTTEGAVNYWTSRNRAVYPRSFEPTLAWNRRLAAEALQFARDRGQHVSFQPIRTDLGAYLGGVL